MMQRMLAVLALAAAIGCTRTASMSPQPSSSSRWLTTWTSSNQQAGRAPGDSIDRTPIYANRTLRQIVRVSIGGEAVRIRFSNEYGDRPLVIGSAHLALRDTGSAIVPSTDRPVTFDGRAWVTLRPGAVVVSDLVTFALPPLRDLAITVLLTDSVRSSTRHSLGLQSNYVSTAGDYSASATMPVETTIAYWLFLSGVDVRNSAGTGVIATIGNSITDGARSTPNTNRRWPDVLATRLLSSSEPAKGIANAGISGNRVLTFGAGPSAMARFDRDVLMQSGVTHVIILEGINDIGNVATKVSADDIIYGLHQLADRAHDRGLVAIGATLTPAGPRPQFTPELEAKRQAVNAWIRTSGVFDAVIDFDAITRDPDNPAQFLPAYDSGDHLHPGDAGYKAMGDAIDLALFRKTRG
jgi:lysophospholipase L1-like esterase